MWYICVCLAVQSQVSDNDTKEKICKKSEEEQKSVKSGMQLVGQFMKCDTVKMWSLFLRECGIAFEISVKQWLGCS